MTRRAVGGLDVGDPVVEEADGVRFAEGVQLVEPDRLLAHRSPKSSKKSSNPPGVYKLRDACRFGPCFGPCFEEDDPLPVEFRGASWGITW